MWTIIELLIYLLACVAIGFLIGYMVCVMVLAYALDKNKVKGYVKESEYIPIWFIQNKLSLYNLVNSSKEATALNDLLDDYDMYRKDRNKYDN